MGACEKFEESISAWVDGALREEERGALMEHMAECRACRAYFDDLTAIHGAMDTAVIPAPEGFADAVLARVRRTAQDKPEAKVIDLRRWRRWAALAACCAVAALGLWSFQGQKAYKAADQMADVPIMARSADAGMAENREPADYELEDCGAGIEAQSDGGDAEAPLPEPQAAPTEAPPGMDEDAPAEAEDALAARDPEETKVFGQEDGAAEPATAGMGPVEDTPIEGDMGKAMTSGGVLTTASPLAKEWVEERLGRVWEPGGSYELTGEEYEELRTLLENAGEAYAEERGSGYALLAE